LFEHIEGLFDGEMPLLFERLGQRCAFDVGRDQVRMPILLAVVIGGEYMHVLKSDQRRGFPGKKGGILLAHCSIIGIVENRDHYWLPLRLMVGKVYRAQLPVSEQALNLILSQCFSDKLIFA
jgi:hypothetical protein